MSRWIRLTWSCLGLLALSGLSATASGGLILSDTFNGTGEVPKNWTKILDPGGTVAETPHNVTITDTTGNHTGIASTLPSSVFNPQTVVTTIQAQVNSTSVTPVGNGIVGLIGTNAQGQLTGVLGLGIDSTGVVFVVEQDPTMSSLQTVLAGMDKGYKGGLVALKLVIEPNAAKPGVLVTAGSFTRTLSFATDLHGFSLAKAFGTQAIPALVGASQPDLSGGSASFASIKVVTSVGSAPVPEPATLSGLVVGLAGLGALGALRRCKR
jgi:hypothetical protein